MKKLILFLLVILLFAFAPDATTIDLKEFGLNATFQNTTSFADVPELSGRNDDKYFEITVRFNSDAKLELEKIPKPFTAAKMMGEFKKMLMQKTKGIVIKKISGGVNDILISRTRDGKTIYKGFFVTSQKKQDVLVMTNDVDELENCNQLLEMAKTLKMY
jgi:hypothetical protein